MYCIRAECQRDRSISSAMAPLSEIDISWDVSQIGGYTIVSFREA